MKHLYSIDVRGSDKQWGFPVRASEQQVADWRADGIEVSGPILNRIPIWAQRLGLTRPLCAVQDTWRWLRIW